MADIREIVRQLSYRDWFFLVGVDGTTPWIQVQFPTILVATGENYLAKCRKWRLSFHMTKSEVVATALKAVLTAEEHEARENFKYRGRAIYNPHLDVDMLHEYSSVKEVRMNYVTSAEDPFALKMPCWVYGNMNHWANTEIIIQENTLNTLT